MSANTITAMYGRELVTSANLREQLEHVEQLWLRAEREADYWYYVANNAAEIRAEHERRLREFDAVRNRANTDAALRLLDELLAERAKEARV